MCGEKVRPLEEKHRFYDEFAGEYELQNLSEVVFGWGDFNGHAAYEIKALGVFTKKMKNAT